VTRNFPRPVDRCDLGFQARYTEQEFLWITEGFRSSGMDEKWDLKFEEPWLHAHRSWTGLIVYGLQLEKTSSGALVLASWINREFFLDEAESDLIGQRLIVKFLIEVFLLRRPASFPYPADFKLTGLARLAFYHMIVGYTPEPRRPVADQSRASRP
jgi:hypothetical protein